MFIVISIYFSKYFTISLSPNFSKTLLFVKINTIRIPIDKVSLVRNFWNQITIYYFVITTIKDCVALFYKLVR